MATLNYMQGRKKYNRPQALLFAELPGQLIEVDNKLTHVPDGVEIGTDYSQVTQLTGAFLTLSDHNRGPIDIKTNRLETRERTISGKMRSYFTADKDTISVSWKNLPSRSFDNVPNFDIDTGKEESGLNRYTVDGGAGGNELLDWYLNHKGSFYVFISYDKYIDFKQEDDVRNRINEYQEVKEVFISDFSYTVNKRGQTKHDLWDVSIVMEEA